MRTTAEYLRKFPQARPSTIVQREFQARRLSELQAQIEAEKRVNEYRQEIRYVSWFRRLFMRAH